VLRPLDHVFFQGIVIQENSNLPNFEYEVIWRTSMRTKRILLAFSSLQLAKVMAIPNFFQEILRIQIKKFANLRNFEYQVT
jgi:hypothetical protein